MNKQQTDQLKRVKAYFPFRICFGVVDKDTGEFSMYAKPTKHLMNKLARDGHKVWYLA